MQLADRPSPGVCSDGDVMVHAHHLADRFRGGHGAEGSYLVDLGHDGRVALDISARVCTVRHAPRASSNRATLRTDAQTWIAIASGELDGIRAFLDGRLQIEGDLHAAVRLTSLFEPIGPAHLDVRQLRTRTSRRVEIASLATGRGTPVVLLHGLGSSLLSFLPTFVALAEHHEVHVLDLPGFGRSSKPMPTGRRYHPSWMSEHVRRYVVAHDLGGAHLIGNSMGGRIATELALTHPTLVRSITGLCPAVAFDQYQPLRPLLRATVPQWAAVAPVRLPLAAVERAMDQLLYDAGSVPPQSRKAVAEDVVAMVRNRRYRLATVAAARHLGAEPASGRGAFWRRLARLDVPSLWIFGRQDVLVHPRYAQRVRAVLPEAQVEVWDQMGHVPQLERPAETHTTIRRFVGQLDRPDGAMRRIG
jgi:pimeloyl-ACP methyl ester carboxylesterase